MMTFARRLLPTSARRALLRQYYGVKGALGGDTSQFGEFNALKGRLTADMPRFIVDVGAYDGITFSVSYPFVRAGWRAVLIEPNPAVYRRLANRHKGNMRVHCVNKACSDKHGTLPLFFGADGEDGQEATLCTDDNELFNSRRGATRIDVEVDTLTNILAESQLPRDIGLLVIDAEGMDFEVLRGLDSKLYSPRLILTEDYPRNAEKHRAKYELLEAERYEFAGMLGCNSLWVHRAG